MKFSVEKSLGDFASSVALGGEQKEQMIGQELKKLYSDQLNKSRSMIAQDQFNARQGLGSELSASALPQGLDPSLVSTLLRSSDMNDPNALMDMIAGHQQNGARGTAIEHVNSREPGMDTVAALNAIASGKNIPDLFSQNADGQVLDNFNGGTAQSPLSQANMGKLFSDAVVNNANAGKHNAQAGLYENQANNVGVDTFSNGTVIDTRGMGGDVGPSVHTQPGGGGDGTTNSLKRNELIQLGYPDELATGIAYGTIKKVADPMGLSTIFINTLNGQEVGRIDAKGQISFNNQIQAMPTNNGGGIPDPLGIR